MSEMGYVREFWERKCVEYEKSLDAIEHSMSVNHNQEMIIRTIKEFVDYCTETKQFCVLQQQLNLTATQLKETKYATAKALQNQYRVSGNPRGDIFDDQITKITLVEPTDEDLETQVVLNVREMIVQNDQIPECGIQMVFQNSDTDELKNVSFAFDGDTAIYKVGEGENNHFQIPNDKKLLGS